MNPLKPPVSLRVVSRRNNGEDCFIQLSVKPHPSRVGM